MQKMAAIQHFGGVSRLAKLLGVSRQAIYKWPDEVPELWQYKIHHLSQGAVAMGAPINPSAATDTSALSLQLLDDFAALLTDEEHRELQLRFAIAIEGGIGFLRGLESKYGTELTEKLIARGLAARQRVDGKVA